MGLDDEMKRNGRLSKRLRNHAVVWAGLVLPTLDELLDLSDGRVGSVQTDFWGRTSRWAWWGRVVAARILILFGGAYVMAVSWGVSFWAAAFVMLLVGWLATII